MVVRSSNFNPCLNVNESNQNLLKTIVIAVYCIFQIHTFVINVNENAAYIIHTGN